MISLTFAKLALECTHVNCYIYYVQVMEHSEELRNKDKEMQRLRMMLEDTEYKYVIAHSKLSEIEKEHEQHVSDLKDKVRITSCCVMCIR